MSRTKILLIIFTVVSILVGSKIYFLSLTSNKRSEPESLVSNLKIKTSNDADLDQKGKSLTATKNLEALRAEVEIQKNKNKEFNSKKKKLTDEIMSLNEHPDAIEKKMNEFSQSLNQEELYVLSSEMSDPALNQDSRAMATELISRNKTEVAFKIFEDFLQDKNYNAKNEFENIIRAQAIEGLMTYPNKDQAIVILEKLETNEQNVFLAGRYRRAVVGLRFNKPVDQQDEVLLKKLLEKQIK